MSQDKFVILRLMKAGEEDRILKVTEDKATRILRCGADIFVFQGLGDPYHYDGELVLNYQQEQVITVL